MLKLHVQHDRRLAFVVNTFWNIDLKITYRRLLEVYLIGLRFRIFFYDEVSFGQLATKNPNLNIVSSRTLVSVLQLFFLCFLQYP